MGEGGPRYALQTELHQRYLADMIPSVDDELAAKLNSELKLEKEMRDANEIPPSVKDFLDNGPFKVSC